MNWFNTRVESISQANDASSSFSLWEKVAAGRMRVPFIDSIKSKRHPHPDPLPEGEGEKHPPRSPALLGNARSSKLCFVVVFATLLALVATSHAAEPQRLTTDSRLKHDPIFINDGKEIIYVCLTRPEQYQLLKLEWEKADAVPIPLHPDETRSELEPAFSADGRYYAHLQSRSPASVAMLIHDTEEKLVAEISPAPGFSGMRHPAIAPDNGKVVYAFSETGAQQLFAVTPQATDRVQLTDSRGINNWPAFSTDGKFITFGSSRDGNFEIYVMRSDGSDVRRLTDNPAQDIRPRFSPDGRLIAFTSNRDGNYEIYLIDVQSGELTRFTDHPERDDYPAWHPSGESIVTVSERNGRHDLYLHPVE
ncbi:MAG: beta-propeller fold lactonase family protein [Planctomycetota bacterium]|nr:beta-propeller fold lactonase family protein [Planctomycetota bacterium]MDA1213782.1 beta-propeller fold lactonase family protein [Planctomycetota bacterium]